MFSTPSLDSATLQHIGDTSGQSNTITLLASEKEAVKQVIADTQKRVDLLNAELSRIQSELKKETARLLPLQVAVAPHKYLPPNVLMHIFNLTKTSDPIQIPPTNTTKGVWALRQVCSLWRKIALNCHPLWSRISVLQHMLKGLEFEDSVISMRQWKRYLNIAIHILSSAGPLELTFALPPSSNGSLMRVAIKRIIAQNRQRVAKLRIIASPYDVEELFRSNTRLFSDLNRLEIDLFGVNYDGERDDTIQYWKPTRIFSKANHLQELSLKGCNDFYKYMSSLEEGPWTQLLHFEVDSEVCDFVDVPSILPALAACQNLCSADLDLRELDTRAIRPHTTINIPNLKNLMVQISSPFSFSCFMLPSLSELNITRNCSLPVAELSSMITQSSCKIQTFRDWRVRPSWMMVSYFSRFDDYGYDDAVVLKFYESFPVLSCLETGMIFDKALLEKIASGQILPLLSRFCGFCDFSVTAEDVIAILTPRFGRKGGRMGSCTCLSLVRAQILQSNPKSFKKELLGKERRAQIFKKYGTAISCWGAWD